MTEDQAAAYRQLLEASRREVLDAVGAQGLAKSRMVVLTTLLRLRQVCCDLRLLKLPETPPETASAKLELFSELLEEILDGGHRVLVFSQFTSHARPPARAARPRDGVGFCYLDGSTTDRAAVVRRFQTSRRRAGVPHQPQGGRHRPEPHRRRHGHPFRSLVESRGGSPGHRPRAPDRPDAHRHQLQTDRPRHGRGKVLRLQERKRATLATVLGEESLAGALDWDEIQELLTD